MKINVKNKTIKIIGVFTIIIILVFSGILLLPRRFGQISEDSMKIPTQYHEPVLLSADVTYNIVFVGIDPSFIDEELVRSHLPEDYDPMNWARSLMMSVTYHERLHFNFTHRFIYAEEEFAKDLFGYANDIAEMGPPTQYLTDYDQNSGQNRLGSGEDIQYVSCTNVEDWIDQHRADYGLVFQKPEYTIFILDSFTSGYMPTDTYHYWEFAEDYWPHVGTTDMRAWGGNYDFLFLDISAAPSDDEGGHDEADDPGNNNVDSASSDPPIWQYDESTRTDFADHLGEDLAYALQLRFVTSYIYHPNNKPVFVDSHIFVEEGALLPTDYLTKIDFDEVIDRLSTEIPWLEWKGQQKIYNLPGDDRGMWEAMREGRIENKGTSIASRTVIGYLERNRDQYCHAPPGYQEIMINLFVLKGAESFDVPYMDYGMAMYTPDGQPWGIFGLTNDANRAQMTEEDWVQWFYTLEVHEPGHIIGLHHPHDGYVNVDGQYIDTLNWLWDQSATIMSYRTTPEGGDLLNIEHIARWHTKKNIDEANKNLDCAYENLKSAGAEWIPSEILKQVRVTEKNVKDAIEAFQMGDWMGAVIQSLQCLNSSRYALNMTGGIKLTDRVIGWDGTLTHAGGFRDTIIGWKRIEVNPYHDYKHIPVTDADESVEVDVEWDNKLQCPNLYAGWSLDGQMYGAVFNDKDERRGSLGCTEHIDLDLNNDFMGSLDGFYAGMGLYDGVAIDVHYKVTVTIHSRSNGGMLTN